VNVFHLFCNNSLLTDCVFPADYQYFGLWAIRNYTKIPTIWKDNQCWAKVS